MCGDKYGCYVMELKKEQPDHSVWVIPGFHYSKPNDVKPHEVSRILLRTRNYTHSDIALLKLAKKLNYNTGIMPICLPQAGYDDDEDMDVYISGYNFHFHRKVPDSKRCRTTGGPSKDMFCKFPFMQKFKNHTTVYKTCVSNPAPKHPECTRLQRVMNWTEQVPKGMHKITIMKDISQYQNKSEEYPDLKEDFVELECHKGTGDAGWCGTCLDFAKKGEPGYCGEDAAEEENEDDKERWEREKPRPTGWGGWGFCDPMCRRLQFKGYRWSNEPQLAEITRKLAAHEDCQEHLGEELNKTRLCLYQELAIDAQASYKMINKSHFEPVHRAKKYYGPAAIQPSVGDAGAPVFKFHEMAGQDTQMANKGVAAAVLLGIISESQFKTLNKKNFNRGKKRQQMSNQVVSRILPVMQWIKDVISEGHHCIERDKME